MTSRQTQPRPGIDQPAADHRSDRVPLYSAEFAADPHAAYYEMRRRYGSLVPIEIYPGVPATLVIGYQTAVRILSDPDHFPADPRRWQEKVPDDLPILPMVEWRPNALRSVGLEHLRYRKATNDALEKVDQHELHEMVERAAAALIAQFPTVGDEYERTADLISIYVQPLVCTVLNEILGCPPEIGQAIAAASAALFDSTDTETVNNMFGQAFLKLVEIKRIEPGDDVATRLVHDSEAKLTDEELIHQFVTCFSAGMEPGQNLIANSLLLMLTDSRFTGNELGFIPTSAVVDEILAMDPPLANYCITYPRQPILVDGVWLPANEPVITSMAACSNDPRMNTGDYAGNGWNLGWGAGPHQCPKHARSAAHRIAVDAIDELLDSVPELRLAVPAAELEWRPGGFHRALAELPVVFPLDPRHRI
ncbi:cytochrome P450 [Nocardia sp. R6R-6]|uniref:cytochrome P450 n=1 Tax=Nocardia sp. R6R-6 TaxID=3459303 RepID=UPI00403D8DF6